MRKLSGKVGIFVILASLLAIFPGAAQACFSCYCNGDYVGCVTTIDYCWNACQPQETKSQASSLQALDPRVVSCTETTQEDQLVFSCTNEPATH